MSVEKLSLTLALGISIGIIPVLGVSTILLTILALVFRLKIPAIQLVNYGIAFIKYALFVPFLKLGQVVFFPSEAHVNIKNILAQYHEDFFGTLRIFWHLNLGGFLVWAFVAIPLGILIYYKSLPYLKRQKVKIIPVISK
jgi:hypothetical protein